MPENLVQETEEAVAPTPATITETTTVEPGAQFSLPTTTALPPAPAAPTPLAEPNPRRGGVWRWWLLALAVVAALVFVKIKYFPTPDAGKDAKGSPGSATGGGAASSGKGGAAPAGGPGGAAGKGSKTLVSVFVVKATNLSDEVAATGSVLAEPCRESSACR